MHSHERVSTIFQDDLLSFSHKKQLFFYSCSWFLLHLHPSLETEPLSHTENGLSNDDCSKVPVPSTQSPHTASDYRATKKERPYYPGHTHTPPPPIRRVSSNPNELGQVLPHRRVEGRKKHTCTYTCIRVKRYLLILYLFATTQHREQLKDRIVLESPAQVVLIIIRYSCSLFSNCSLQKKFDVFHFSIIKSKINTSDYCLECSQVGY